MLKEGINSVSKKANSSRLRRFTANPLKYVFALGYRLIIFPFYKKPYYKKTKTFWNDSFLVALPAATDIYLTGGKTDDSEIRLAMFMVNTLQPGDFFLDIGSHFGYFSRLALECINEKGFVLSIEPAKETFKVLQINLEGHPSAIAINCLVGEKDENREFYQFPILHSEYNTAYPKQFEETNWFKNMPVNKEWVTCRSVDSLLSSYNKTPKFIKIDTEGSEFEVIKGASNLLSEQKDLIIVMEILSKKRKNEVHLKALHLLQKFGYNTFTITSGGEIERCIDVESYLLENKIDSDNIVFRYGG